MDSKLSRGRLRYLVKWKGYPERHHWTWEPLSNLTHADEAITEFHSSHPAAPRRVNKNDFTFVPIPPPDTIPQPVAEWTNGKINVDTWSVDINQFKNISPPHTPPPDDGWGPLEPYPGSWTPPRRDSPPPCRPPSPRTKTTPENHALIHWVFCHDPNCQYHRGETSWYG